MVKIVIIRGSKVVRSENFKNVGKRRGPLPGPKYTRFFYKKLG